MSVSRARLRGQISYAARASRAIAGDPYEGVERVLERAAEWRDHRRDRVPNPVVPDFEQRVHELIGAPWPCRAEGFEEVWDAALADLAAHRLEVGRSAYGGWDDGDVRLAQAAWCLTRHLRPVRVVETGVARGLTTRVVLEALAANQEGRLWSIDLPPLLEHQLAAETATAVPPWLHDRWTLVRGSSRRRLPGLVRSLGEIDLFIHDSMHTTRNLSFELRLIWPALRAGGAALIDDVNANDGVATFVREHPGSPAIISAAGDGRALIGLLAKPGPNVSAGSAGAQ